MFESRLKKSIAGMERIRREREKLDQKRSEAQAQLISLRRQTPDAIAEALLGDAPNQAAVDPIEVSGQLIAQERRAQAVIEMAGRAEPAVVGRLAAAWRDVIEAEAQEADREAGQAQQRFEEHAGKVKQALAELEALNGPYMPVADHIRWRAAAENAHKAMSAQPLRFLKPPLESLAEEAARLRAHAQWLRERPVHQSGNLTGTLEQLLEQFRQPFWIGPSESSLRQWCEEKAAEALTKWEQRGDRLLAARDRFYNGHTVSFALVWKDGAIVNGSAKVEMLPGKTAAVGSMQELIGGPAYGT